MVTTIDETTRWQKSQYIINNLGMQSADVPDDIISFLKENVNYKNVYTQNLAGHLKEEYRYDGWPMHFEKWLMNIIDNSNNLSAHLSSSNIQLLTKDLPLVLETIWINKQKKHEFNPFHSHKGVFSFIIFLKIPYDLENENKVFPKNSDIEPSTSKLSFLLTDNLGDIVEIKISVDKSFENKMIMFPSKMKHLVYPFYTSDDLRMTVSGNVLIED